MPSFCMCAHGPKEPAHAKQNKWIKCESNEKWREKETNSQQQRKKSASGTVGSRQQANYMHVSFFSLLLFETSSRMEKKEKIPIHANPVALYSLWLNSRWNKNQQHIEHWMTCLIRECVCLIILFHRFVFYFAFFIVHLVFSSSSSSLFYINFIIFPNCFVVAVFRFNFLLCVCAYAKCMCNV